MDEKTIVSHLATVENGHYLSPYGIPTAKLLQDNFDQLNKRYFIHDISDLYERLPSGEDIYVLSHIVTEDFPKHNHDYFELTYIVKGNVLNIIDGNELYMSMGDISLVNPQAIHELHCINPDTTLVNICIKPSLMDGTLQQFAQSDSPISAFLSGHSSKAPSKNSASASGLNRENESVPAKYMFFSVGYAKEVALYINHVIHEYVSSNFHQTFSLEAWLLLLLDFLANCSHYSYIGIDRKALKVLQYIQEHCLRQSLETMASNLGYNANYLTRYLKNRTGRSYHEIVREVRLQTALRLLAETSLSIYDISETCGYNSPSHFFRIFREQFHMTPKKYRDLFVK